MKRLRYRQVTHDPGRYSDWVILAHSCRGRSHRMACCDCGLVHDTQTRAFRVVRRKGKIVGYRPISRHDVVVMSMVKRNDRSTAQRRRAKKHSGIAKAIRRRA